VWRPAPARHHRPVRPSPLPALLAARPFSTAQARASGVHPERLRRADLTAPHHGVRAPRARSDDDPHGAAPRVVDACRRLVPGLTDQHVFSHGTALQLWGLPAPSRLERDPTLHVTALSGREPRRPGVQGHRVAVPTAHVGRVEGLAVVSPIEAWLQTAPLMTLDEAIVVGDALAGRWSRHSSARRLPVQRLVDAATAARGRPGAVRLREATSWIRARVESPQETRMRLLVVRSGLPEFAVNIDVVDDQGRFVARPDGQYPDRRVAVEYQGDHHRADRETWRRDVRRRARLVALGWSVVEATDDDIAAGTRADFLDDLARLLS